MYDLRFKGKQKKQFSKLLQKLSPGVKSKLKNTLQNNPYPSVTNGTNLCKVEQKGRLYGIEVTGGDRVLYDIIDLDADNKAVLIYYAGNHDGEIRALKKYAK